MNLRSFLLLIALSFCCIAIPARAEAAARFFLTPSSGTYNVGEKVTASVAIDSGGQAINAGEATVTFSSDILEYQSVSSSGSIFAFWTSGPTGGATSVSFSGGLSNPGYTGASGKVLSITWKVKAKGDGKVTINGKKILANDGVGTNVLGSSSGGTFKGTAPVQGINITSSTHPDQSKWYSKRDITLNWSGGSGTLYATAFDQSAATVPSGSGASAKTFTKTGVADGVWYFHVKVTNSSEAVSVAHFKMQIDATAPEAFTPLLEAASPNDPSPKLTVEAKDALSGVIKYEIKIDSGEFIEIKSGDKLPKLRSGKHTITIRAHDAAGNTRDAEIAYTVTGLPPIELLTWTKRATLSSPLSFTAQSGADDTIIVFLDGKEVDRFTAKDFRINTSERARAQGNSEIDVTWQYHYSGFLKPGRHVFQFSRITPEGAESELSQEYVVYIWDNAFALFGVIISIWWVVIAQGVIIVLLLLLLWKRRRAKTHRESDTHKPDKPDKPEKKVN